MFNEVSYRNPGHYWHLTCEVQLDDEFCSREYFNTNARRRSTFLGIIAMIGWRQVAANKTYLWACPSCVSLIEREPATWKERQDFEVAYAAETLPGQKNFKSL